MDKEPHCYGVFSAPIELYALYYSMFLYVNNTRHNIFTDKSVITFMLVFLY